ncbi:hypothetical protein BCER1_17170 [Bacillus cereus]|nr:hypothetical protein BCER1_17170 [Bacillus cereus]
MKGRDVVLGLLMQKELSGYDIKIVFEDVFTHFFDGSFGMIYPTLRQLENEGKIKKRLSCKRENRIRKCTLLQMRGVKNFINTCRHL